MAKKVVKVPDIEGPRAQLCYVQAETMERCMIKKGHRGFHDWEMRKEILRLNAMISQFRRVYTA